MVIEVGGINRYAQNVFLFLQRGERADNLGLLIRHQESSLRLEEYLGLVLIGDLPLILERDARLILNGELLLARYPGVRGRVEEFCLIGNRELRLVAVAYQVQALDV